MPQSDKMTKMVPGRYGRRESNFGLISNLDVVYFGCDFVSLSRGVVDRSEFYGLVAGAGCPYLKISKKQLVPMNDPAFRP